MTHLMAAPRIKKKKQPDIKTSVLPRQGAIPCLVLLAIVLICGIIYVFYSNTARLIHRLGPRGEQIVNRLSAFLVFCIGMQIAWSGLKTLLKT